MYSNNDTIVSVREFVGNAQCLIDGTIARRANLIIFDDATGKDVISFSYRELELFVSERCG